MLESWNGQTLPSVHTWVFRRAIAIQGGSVDFTGSVAATLSKFLFGLPMSPEDFTATKSMTDDAGVSALVDITFGTEDVVSVATTDVVIFVLAAEPEWLLADGFAACVERQLLVTFPGSTE